MTAKHILTAGPTITDREINYVLEAVKYGWNDNWSGFLTRFERAMASYVGTTYALATSSCTGALHLALRGLGVQPGDEVIVPEITWVATASAVTYCGAEPVFVDIEPDTWCIDPQRLRESITPRTKVIIPVHIYGHPANMSAVMQIAREYNLKVLEDAAPALGATVDGQRVGSIGNVGAFSFQGAKIMTTGEGGMLVTSDEELFERITFIADHGRDKHIPFLISAIGLKYKMSNLQAALGLGQIERIEEMIQKKRLIYRWYRERLEDVPHITMNTERANTHNICWMTSIVLQPGCPVDRQAAMRRLKEEHIDSRPFFPPVSSFPMFESQAARNPVAYEVAKNGINLPSGHNLTEQDIDRVCNVLRRTLRTHTLPPKFETVAATPLPVEVVEAQVTATIAEMKQPGCTSTLPIYLGRKLAGYLKPVTYDDLGSPEAVALLANWRDAAADSFPSQFPVTALGTERWLKLQLLDLPGRILFWIADLNETRVGHIGLFRFDFKERTVELDNVIRGSSEAPRGIMEAAAQALHAWAFDVLSMNAIYLRVMSNNQRALRLYNRCGYQELFRVPLACSVDGDTVHWIEVGSEHRRPIDRHFVTMCLLESNWKQNAALVSTSNAPLSRPHMLNRGGRVTL